MLLSLFYYNVCKLIFVPMPEQDYSTIEHDFLHVKDCFSNYKFTYKERRSRLDFLLNIANEPARDTASLIASSKEQLVEVKDFYRKIDEEIRQLSIEIHREEEKLSQNSERFRELEEMENALQNEYEHLADLHEKVLISDKVNEEFDEIEQGINEMFIEIEKKKAVTGGTLINSKLEEEGQLKEIRDDLAAKQRRLTIINTENYIEDMFYWKKQYLEILEKIFGSVSVSSSDDRSCVKIARKGNVLEVNIKGKRVVDCFISKNSLDEEHQREFEAIKSYSLRINEVRPLLMYFAINC